MTDWSRIVAYGRFSSLGQKNGTSLERQLGDIRAYCAAKGWTIDEEVTDEGRSAFHGHHRSKGHLGEFEQEALAGGEAGTLVIVERLDRLSRQEAEDGYDFIRGLTKAGVSILTLDDEFIYRAGQPLDMLKIITLLIKFSTAREEAVKRSDRSKSNWKIKHQRAVEQGVAPSARCPSWLNVVDGRYEVIEEKGQVLRRMFEMADAGDGSTTILKTFVDENVPRVGNSRIWQRERIVEFLRDRRLLGEAVINGEVVKLYPPVIPADLFERVAGNADARKAAAGGRRSVRVANLLSGLSRCHVCNGRMRHINSGYLRCWNATQHNCTNRLSLRYDRLEKAVLDSCLHLALDDNAFSNKVEVHRLNRTINERERELQLAIQHAENAWDAALREPSPIAEKKARQYEKEANELTANLGALKRQREKAKGRASNLEHMNRIADMRKHITTDVTLRKRVAQGLQTLITAAYFDPDGLVTLVMAGGLKIIQIRDGVVLGEVDAPESGGLLIFAGKRDSGGFKSVVRRMADDTPDAAAG